MDCLIRAQNAGYDISDYTDVHGPFGTLQDMDDLIRQTHDRGMKIILDLVINHTSDQHRWFKESRSSKHNPKRDWYIWRPAKYDNKGNRMPPGNWRSNFSQSACKLPDSSNLELYAQRYCEQGPGTSRARSTICICFAQNSLISIGRTKSAARQSTRTPYTSGFAVGLMASA